MKLPTKPSIYASSPKDYLMMFYGPPGVGKTTFVNGLGKRVLFISTDRGARFLKALRIEVHTWKRLELTIEELEKGKVEYDIIALDHLDDICFLAESHICKKLKIESLSDLEWGKAWKVYKDYMRLLTSRLLNLGVGVVYICHETIKTVRTRAIEQEVTCPSLPSTTSKIIIPMMDIIGYCGFKTIRVKVKVKDKTKGGKVGRIKRVEKRILITEPTENLQAKDRTNRKKGELEYLSPKSFMESFTITS